jgi:negative regulator of flagellin synthesis FlgM
MTVERIGPLEPASNIQKTEKPARVRSKGGADSINVSEEARSRSEIFKAPDTRPDRVAEVKRKLQDPSYPSDEVIEKTAEGVMKAFGL